MPFEDLPLLLLPLADEGSAVEGDTGDEKDFVCGMKMVGVGRPFDRPFVGTVVFGGGKFA